MGFFDFLKRDRGLTAEPISNTTDARRDELIAEARSERDACIFRIDELADELRRERGFIHFYRRKRK